MELAAVRTNIRKIRVEILFFICCLMFIHESSHQLVGHLLYNMFTVDKPTLKRG
jgi:hypothetical protein